MTYVGIDLHSNNMVNVSINSNREVISQAKLPTARRSLEDFFGTFDGPVKGFGCRQVIRLDQRSWSPAKGLN
jgi:hypothetical protein